MKTIETLDSKKYFELYYNDHLYLSPRMNYMFNLDRDGELDKKIAEYLGISEKSTNFADIYVFSGRTKSELDKMFGNGKGTNRLGEGRATTYFIKVLGKIVLLFLDSRGVAVEMEARLTKEEYINISFELFKYLYENMDQNSKEFINYKKSRKI